MLPAVLIAAFGTIAAAVPSRDDFRDLLLRASVVFGIALLAITELLSAFAALRRVPLLVAWLAVIIGSLILVWRRGLPRGRFSLAALRDPVGILCVGGTAGILLLTAIPAVYSPPNTADAIGISY